MLTFLFFVLLFGIFGKLIWLAVRAAWGISKIVFSIVFLPVVVLVLFFSVYPASRESFATLANVQVTLGTQTAGSVIRPASFCGCAAIKPSFRLLPTVGVKTFSWALDTLGFPVGTVEFSQREVLVRYREGLRSVAERLAQRHGLHVREYRRGPRPPALQAQLPLGL